MTNLNNLEKQLWSDVTSDLGHIQANWGDHWSFNFRNDPKRLAFVLSRYKFSAKMICKNNHVLELGCSSGIGAPILAEFAKSYTGIDLDEQALATARENFVDTTFTFHYDDFMGKSYGKFGAVVSLDVVEHILPDYESTYFTTILENLDEDGMCVIGTPNITSSPYASEFSKMGHVNMYSQERLVAVLKNYFYHVLPFGMNDEVVHTGYAPMTHYIFCVCCHKKNEELWKK